MKYLLGALALLGLASAPAQAQRVLEPNSNWIMNYDDDSCALQRQFGEDEGDQVFLELRQFSPTGNLQVLVSSSDIARRSDQTIYVTLEPIDEESEETYAFNVKFADGHEGKLFSYSLNRLTSRYFDLRRSSIQDSDILSESEKEMLSGVLGMGPEDREYVRLYQTEAYQNANRRFNHAFSQSAEFIEFRNRMEAEIDGIQIRRAFSPTLSLRTGSLHEPMQAMRTCLDELLTHWGVDAEAHRSLLRPVTPVDYAEWAGQIAQVYPSQMASRGMEGYLHVRLDVSEEGKPTNCQFQSPGNNEAFEQTACRLLMENARFLPALDASGDPLPSVFQTSLLYRMR